MLKIGEPYFLKNKEWYYHDDKKNRFYLTDKAPEEARKSYEEFYEYHYDSFDYAILKDYQNRLYERHIKEGKTPEEAKRLSDKWWDELVKGK